MTTADQPAVIANPGVKAGVEPERHESFELQLLFPLICPAGQPVALAVSFIDAGGETTERLSQPCQGEWLRDATAPANSSTQWSVSAIPGLPSLLATEAGQGPYLLFSPPSVASGVHPFLYQVSAGGVVIAQAPITATTTPEHRVAEDSPAFEDCVNVAEVRRSVAGAGYCIAATKSTFVAGWPAPRGASVVLLCARGHTARAPSVRPTHCDTLGSRESFALGSNLIDLVWRGWGGPEATATGFELGYHSPQVRLPARLRA